MTERATNGPSLRRHILTTADGVKLDARVQGMERPSTMVVWCHPHPMFGGSMFAPLMNAVADGLARSGVGVLRFDFRGVGESEGTHGDGVAEVADVEAAVHQARIWAPGVVLAGWSFGALVALRFLARSRMSMPYVGVAPPIGDPAEFADVDGASMTFVLAVRDQVVDIDLVTRLATSIGAHVIRVDSDHLFLMRSEPVTEAIIGAINPG